MKKLIIIFILGFIGVQSAFALEVYLKNGDKISGVVMTEDATTMVLQTMGAGNIRINKAFINMPKTYPEKYAPPRTTASAPPTPAVQWQKDVSLGYTQVGGNTKSQLGQISADLDRKTPQDEWTVKYDATYSSDNDQMSGKKFYGQLRYAYSFGEDLKWYNYYKLEGHQDYFADIDYQVDPATGIGYWFSNTLDFKANAEVGAGFQYTQYRTGSAPDAGGEPVLVPHFFVDKRLIGGLHLSEDFTYYPSLFRLSDYRWRSETDLVNQINKYWALKISFVDDYNAMPPAGVDKNDYTWTTSLEYKFQ